jgi:hypothetical protein
MCVGRMGLFTWLNDKVTQVRQQVFGGDDGNDGNNDGSVGADQRCVAANALRALLCSCRVYVAEVIRIVRSPPTR